MLDMGFIKDIRKIVSLLPEQRQNLLFSATFSPDIRRLAKGVIRQDPVEIDIAPRNKPIDLVDQIVHPVDKTNKARLLNHLIVSGQWDQVLVFCRTKHGADKLARQLHQYGIDAGTIHGDKAQAQRTKALRDFKAGKVRVLVATDIAARGIDINELPRVVNFDLPDSAEDYVHRIGRTGRAGRKGEAISLVSIDETIKLRDIEKLTKSEITRKTIEGFEPVTALPTTSGKKVLRSARSFAPRTGGRHSYKGLGKSRR
jgi:ATP-dependent RNA helicase RhlE